MPAHSGARTRPLSFCVGGAALTSSWTCEHRGGPGSRGDVVPLLTTRCRCCSQLEGTELDQLLSNLQNQKLAGGPSNLFLTCPPGDSDASLKTTDICRPAGPAAPNVLTCADGQRNSLSPTWNSRCDLTWAGPTYSELGHFPCKMEVVVPTKQSCYDSVTVL